ncbi:MAG TPA: PAS domain-containing protein [Candidatus Acidoferrales bacterium]|nr:PAS domain-containing protein [Candidatus Acidoferrales bacterium]
MANNVRSLIGQRRKAARDSVSIAFPTEEQTSVWRSLKGGLLEAGTLLELIPYPGALWTRDRRLCVFNDAARQLTGFCEHDLRASDALWLERIPPRDRASFLAEWKRLQSGEKQISCSYRFLPKNRGSEIRLREVAVSYPIPGDVPGVWSLYIEEPIEEDLTSVQHVRELLRGLTHEIGNSLQAISGELDLLRLSGTLAPESSSTLARGVHQIRRLAREIEEYLSPPPLHLKLVDPATVLNEIIQSRQRELIAQGIQISVVLREPLPKVPLDEQFRSALDRVIDFSCALLPGGGELKIEAGIQRIGAADHIELTLLTASPTSITLEETDVFRPFLKINGCRVGLSMAVARQILRRHFGKIVFRKERSDRGVFSILIRVPSDA